LFALTAAPALAVPKRSIFEVPPTSDNAIPGGASVFALPVSKTTGPIRGTLFGT
jgi:hypothetical protein